MATIAVPVAADAAGTKKCIATFGSNCGELTMRDGTPKLYRYGRCQGSKMITVQSERMPRMTGKVIVIDQARFTVTKTTSSSISGVWQLGGPPREKVFICE